MPKPYALSLYQPPTQATQRFQRSLTQTARGWKRSIRSNGGCWQGSFSLDGSPQELQAAFEGWLGYEVRERAAGMLSWSGMVYEMDLTSNGITRRKSLDLMANRVKVTFTKESYGGDNFVKAPSFDTGTVAAGNDNFDSWLENDDGGVGGINRNAVIFHAGGSIASLEMTGSGNNPYGVPQTAPLPADSTWVRQNVDVTPGAKYHFSFWQYGGGAVGAGNSGGFGLRNPATQTWIMAPRATGYTTAAWREFSYEELIGPSDGEIMIFFFAPTTLNAISYFDDVELLEKGQNLHESGWVTIDDNPLGDVAADDPAGSPPIVRYGVKEEVLHLDNYSEATSIAYRDTFLQENAYPWPRPVAAGKKGSTTLEVTVAGYVWTMNFMYVQNSLGANDSIDDWLKLIVGSTYGRSPAHGGTSAANDAGDCQFVRYIGTTIMENTLLVPQTTPVEERPWDLIQELASLGDGTHLWRAWVDPTRTFYYRPIATLTSPLTPPAPRYYIRRDGIYDTMAGTMPSNPWLMQPAVYRDMTYRSTATEHGLFLPDPRDMYVEEVEMADGWDQAQLKTTLFSEADLLLREPDREPEKPPYAIRW